MAVQQCTVALLVAVALVAGPAVSYAAEAGYAPAGPQPKATTEEQKLAEKANNAFKAAVAAAAAAPPEDKSNIFVKTFTQNNGNWSLEGVTDASSSTDSLNTRVTFAMMRALWDTKGATPEAKYDSFVAIFSESLRIIAGILERCGFREVIHKPAEFQAHLHLFALWQDDTHRVADLPAEQQSRRRQAGCGRTAASGQATAQWRRLFGGFFAHQGLTTSSRVIGNA